MEILKINTESVYCVGDLHGNFKDILYFIKTNDIKNSVIIFCGDIGIGFYKPDYYEQIFNKIKKELSKRNLYILFCRGNHDCLSLDTEVLTNNGWKLFNELTLNDNILSYDEINNCSTWKSIDRLIYKENENLFLSKGQSIDIKCTFNHRHLVFDKKCANSKYCTTSELKRYRYKSLKLCHGAVINNEDYDISDDEIKLIGWLMTDGYIEKRSKTYSISQSKIKNIDEIKNILNNLKLIYSHQKREDKLNKKIIIKGKTVKHCLIENVFRINVESSKIIKSLLPDNKKLPNWLYKLSYRQLKIFIDTLIKADGTILNRKGNYMLYGNYDILSQFQPLFNMCGKRCSLVKDKRGDFRLNICDDNFSGIMPNTRYFEKQNIKENCFCLQTEMSNFFVRRNGKSYFTGNCSDEFNGNTYKDKRIRTLRDYTVTQIFDINDIEYKGTSYNILNVGGAISIDRTYRLARTERRALEYMHHHGCLFEEAFRKCPQEYWIGEEPFFDKNKLDEIKNNGVKINAICTHTCPDFCVPYTKEGIRGWLLEDDKLEGDLNKERQVMTNLYEKVIADGHPLETWCYGHYHIHNTEIIDNVKFHLLDMDRNGVMDFVEIYRTDNESNENIVP